MSNAFETLGLPISLTIGAETLGAAFREAGKAAHPDAGGGEDEFAALREAFETLASPSRRLRHWLELRNASADIRGIVSPDLMGLFSEVNTATGRAESLIRQRDETKTALGLAMLARETQFCREAIERSLALVEGAIDRECAAFPEIERNAGGGDRAATVARNLAFLEKWRAGLRSVFARLV